ncbi:MAG: zf-HC2 domain-containing protein [Planctomycetaceae bacterium]|nr:zf-HC2 domain-containing protein [Planctomycetaceae bacterium]
MSAMEKSCPDTQVLARYLEGGLSADERARMIGHLADCDDCRRAVSLASTLDAAPATPVNEILLQKVVSGSRRRRYGSLGLAAAALLAAAVGITLFKSSAPTPELAPVAEERRVERQPEVAVTRPAPPVEPVPPPPPPAVAETPRPAEPAPLVAAPKETPKPAPAPVEPRPELPKPDPKPETPPSEVAKPELPKPAPVEDKGLAPVLVVDATGDLWLKRDQDEAKAGVCERAAWKDRLTARSGAASFSLEARASVMLEKGSDAAISKVRSDDSYNLALGQGLVMLDTEGSSQKWRIAFGQSELDFNNLNGRLSVESRGDRLSAMLLDGSAELKIGALAKKATVGQEVVLSREGQIVEQKGEALKKMARFDELRPKLFMAFAATFDEKKDDLPLFPYTVKEGRLVPGPTGLYLMCEGPPSPKAGERMTIAGEVRPDRAFSVASGMVLKFRYRTTLPGFSVKLGRYAVDVAARRAGQWADAEVPLREFTFEGTPLLPTDPVDGIRFSASFEKRLGQLDIDGVQFLRRVK